MTVYLACAAGSMKQRQHPCVGIDPIIANFATAVETDNRNVAQQWRFFFHINSFFAHQASDADGLTIRDPNVGLHFSDWKI